MTRTPPTLRFRQHPVSLVLGTMFAAMCVILAGAGVLSDAAFIVRMAAALGLAAGIGWTVAAWSQHVTVDAPGISTQRIVWRESTEWATVDAVVVQYVVNRFGSGWSYSLRLRDGRRVPRETFGEVRLRDRDRDRLIAWIERHVPDVPVTIDRTWPRPRPPRPPAPRLQPDPAETIRSVRRATVGPYRIVVTGLDGGFVAIVRRTDGTEITRGPIREIYRDALDDGSGFVETYGGAEDDVR